MHANGQTQKVYDNILQCIGNTPMVKLNRIPDIYGLECDLYAKCEFLNPGGSLKDRISYTMVRDAERTGRIKQNTRLVEPTSGNTGIGVSLTAAVCGYDCTIVTPDKNSDEKMSTMNILGTEIIQTPAMAHSDDPESFMAVTKRILEEDPNAISMDQYSNQVNPMTHYDYTAEEILDALGTVDMFVMGSGTGGTVTGIGRKLKEKCPNCIIVTVDPEGSIIFGGGEPKLYYVEGIGGDFVPEVLDKTVIDRVIKPNDYQSFNMAREIIIKEGLLCGGSSGAITYSAIQAAKDYKLGHGKKVVVILPDGIRNYMTKFVNDQWMEAHLFKEPPERDFPWWNRCISNLKVDPSVPSVKDNHSCYDALAAMGSDSQMAFVVDVNGLLKGVVSKNSLRSEATNPKKKGSLDFNEVVLKHVMKNHYVITENKGNPTVGLASRMLDIAPFIVVVEEYVKGDIKGNIPKGILTSEIVLDYIITHQDHI